MSNYRHIQCDGAHLAENDLLSSHDDCKCAGYFHDSGADFHSMRANARRHDWTILRVVGARYDLCPFCATGIKG